MERVALVTGGTRGIGAAISLALKNAGYNVAANYAVRDEVAKEFEQDTGIPSYKWDISDDGSLPGGEMVAEELDGPIEILVNNAGITRDGAMHKMPTGELGHGHRNQSQFLLLYVPRVVIDPMRENKFGRIINISSINGQLGQFGQTNYSAAKAGIFGFTKALCARNRRSRHHRQRHRPRLYRNRHDQRHSGKCFAENHRRRSGGPHGQAGGNRPRRGVPRRRRGRLHHRRDAFHQWRTVYGVIWLAADAQRSAGCLPRCSAARRG